MILGVLFWSRVFRTLSPKEKKSKTRVAGNEILAVGNSLGPQVSGAELQEEEILAVGNPPAPQVAGADLQEKKFSLWDSSSPRMFALI